MESFALDVLNLRRAFKSWGLNFLGWVLAGNGMINSGRFNDQLGVDNFQNSIENGVDLDVDFLAGVAFEGWWTKRQVFGRCRLYAFTD